MSLRDSNKQGNALVSASVGGVKKPFGSAGGVARPSGAGLTVLQKMAIKEPTLGFQANIGFVIDATGSRSSNWEEAQSIQAKMFESVSSFAKMNLRVIHYGGDEVSNNSWESNPETVKSLMSEVRCRGGNTQIVESLSLFMSSDNKIMPRSIILVGDSFEEDMSDLTNIAQKLLEHKIKVFSFLDGNDSDAEEAFKFLSQKTGGVFAKFGSDMPLKDLCEGVALMSAGGQSALSRLQNSAARDLLLSAKP